MENTREEKVFEVVADDGPGKTFAAGAGTETFACEDVFLFAPAIGVGECGGSLALDVDAGGFHEDWGFGVRR